jgi:hypothetical protein
MSFAACRELRHKPVSRTTSSSSFDARTWTRNACLRLWKAVICQFVPWDPREVDGLKGANMSFRSEVFAKVRFDKRLRGSGATPNEDLRFRLP